MQDGSLLLNPASQLLLALRDRDQFAVPSLYSSSTVTVRAQCSLLTAIVVGYT